MQKSPHERERVWLPFPQVTLQGPHALHSASFSPKGTRIISQNIIITIFFFFLVPIPIPHIGFEKNP